jgi:hypothetical protein
MTVGFQLPSIFLQDGFIIFRLTHSIIRTRLRLTPVRLVPFFRQARANVVFTVEILMFSSTVLVSSLLFLLPCVSADEVQRREQGNTTPISLILINENHSHFNELSFDLFEANIPPASVSRRGLFVPNTVRMK